MVNQDLALKWSCTNGDLRALVFEFRFDQDPTKKKKKEKMPHVPSYSKIFEDNMLLLLSHLVFLAHFRVVVVKE